MLRGLVTEALQVALGSCALELSLLLAESVALGRSIVGLQFLKHRNLPLDYVKSVTFIICFPIFTLLTPNCCEMLARRVEYVIVLTLNNYKEQRYVNELS